MLYWHWLILAAVLLIIEMLTFTSFFLFFAIATSIVAVVTFFVPELALSMQLLVFGVLSLFAVVLAYRMFRVKKQQKYEGLDVNDRMGHYIGQYIILVEDAYEGVAKAKIGDAMWRVIINDGRKGDKIKIIAIQSTSFVAEKIDK